MNKLVIIGIVVALSITIGLFSIYFLGNDNPVEEACEDVIKDETGADIDLSPSDSVDTISGNENKAS